MVGIFIVERNKPRILIETLERGIDDRHRKHTDRNHRVQYKK